MRQPSRIVRWGKSTFAPGVRVPEFWTEENFQRQFRNRYVNYTVKGERKRKPLSQWWMQRHDRYNYDGMVFDSTKHMDAAADEVNLCAVLAAKKSPAGDWSMMRRHIREILAANDEPSDIYIMRWLAFAVQNPTKAAEVAVALMSREKGTGNPGSHLGHWWRAQRWMIEEQPTRKSIHVRGFGNGDCHSLSDRSFS